MFNIRMEIAFDDDPLARPTNWTRIDTTCPVRSLRTVRGANLKTGDFEAGEASAVVDNRTRDLDPTYTNGTWYGDLTLRKRVRFTYDDGGTTVVWTGYLDRLPNAWDLSASDGWVNLSAVDMLAILADLQLPPSVLHQAIVDLSPKAYWPLSEMQGTFADDVVGTWDGTYRRPVTDSAAVMPYDSRPKSSFNQPYQDDPSGQAVTVRGFGGSGTQTVSFWFYREDPWRGLTMWVQSSLANPEPGGANGYQFWIGTDSVDGELLVLINDGTGAETGQTVTGISPVGLHHFVVVIDSTLGSDQVTAYVDGVVAPWLQLDPDNPVDPFAGVDLDTMAAGLADLFLGYGVTSDAASATDTYVANVADVAYWDSALTAQQIADLYAAGTTAWDGDTTGARLERVLDALGVDDDDRDLATGQESCGPTRLGGNALDYLRRIVATEGGALFVSADGKITFTERPANNPTPLDVIGDSGCPYSAITLDYSLDRMVNTAGVTRENGITQTHSNSTAVTTFGPRSVEVDTLHRSPSGAKGRAAELVVRNKDLRTQILDVTLHGRRTDVPTAVSLDTEIGDPYTVSYQPPAGSAGTALVRVERIEHDFAPGEWTVRLGVDQQVVLPAFQLDTAGRGTDQAVLSS